MPEHKDIQDPDLHEPKGITTASAGELYLANGEGGGEWKVPLGIDTALEGQQFISDGEGNGTWTTPGGAQLGSVYFSGNAVDTVITSSGVDVILDPGVWSPTVVDTIVFSTNKFTVMTAGVYELHASVSFSGGAGGAGDTYRFSFGKNGVAMPTSPVIRRQTSSSDIGSGGSSTFQSLLIGDEVTILVQNETSVNNPTITDASFTIVLLKEA